jgi:prolyl-tRNA synthetase
MTYTADTYDELKKIFDGSGTGFVYTHWCGDPECEDKIKEDTTATIRCIAFDQPEDEGKCVVCGKSSRKRVILAKAY